MSESRKPHLTTYQRRCWVELKGQLFGGGREFSFIVGQHDLKVLALLEKFVKVGLLQKSGDHRFLLPEPAPGLLRGGDWLPEDDLTDLDLGILEAE